LSTQLTMRKTDTNVWSLRSQKRLNSFIGCIPARQTWPRLPSAYPKRVAHTLAVPNSTFSELLLHRMRPKDLIVNR